MDNTFSFNKWLISSEKIFSSEIKGFEDYYPIESLQYSISISGIIDKNSRSDSVLVVSPLVITLSSGLHSPSIIDRIANKKNLKAINIIKVSEEKGKLTIVEDKKFETVYIHGINTTNETVILSFRYEQYVDKYNEIVNNISKGSSSGKLDIVKWK